MKINFKNITQQYDVIGQAYIEGQNAFFSDQENWGRKKIQDILPDLIKK